MIAKSTNISRVDWKRGNLLITFQGGERYEFFNFPKQEFVRVCLDELHHVERWGQYYERIIRPNWTIRNVDYRRIS